MSKKRKSLGYSFADEVLKVSFKKKHFKKVEAQNWVDNLLPNFDPNSENYIKKDNWKTTLILSLCLILFFTLFVRLFHLQIVKGKNNRELADGNRIQIKVIHAPRGVIFDRNGKVLAANSPAFRLFDKNNQKTKFITREEALELEVKNDPQTLDLEVDNLRSYPMSEKMAHVLGYVGEVSQEQLKDADFKTYKLGDRVGKEGIEAQYEKILRGVDGGEIVEVDSFGNKLRTLRRNPPIPGQNIYLTIDKDLQERVYTLAEGTLLKVGSCCAAAVAMEPSSGQILALVSLPSFDPNLFTSNVSEGEILQIFSNPNSPILNRVTSGTYPPGSTFKIISSLAALSSGKITPQTIVQDNGVIYLGAFKFTNWYFTQYGKVEGALNLVKAIQRSNDIYFYEVGRVVGEKSLADWSKKLKLGGKLNIDLPAESEGIVPDDEWKRKTLGEVWYPGDTLHMAIGQGFVLTSPLQILGITSYIAANGNLYKPQLLQKITNKDNIIFEYKPKTLVSNLISKDKIDVIKKGLEQVTKYGGTAWPFFTFPISTAGKTGTAEYGDPKGRVHAWYTSYAPATDPKIAMTVLIEGGGEGSSVAAPIVKETFRWYFSEDKNKLIQDIYTPATESGRTLGE